MNIPPKYEDVVAQLEAALGREAVLERKNANQCESIRQYQDREAQLLSDKMDDDNTFNAANEKLRRSEVALQQRLTVAEQRESDLKKLLCDVINESPTGFAALKVDLAHRVNDELKPATEG